MKQGDIVYSKSSLEEFPSSYKLYRIVKMNNEFVTLLPLKRKIIYIGRTEEENNLIKNGRIYQDTPRTIEPTEFLEGIPIKRKIIYKNDGTSKIRIDEFSKIEGVYKGIPLEEYKA